MELRVDQHYWRERSARALNRASQLKQRPWRITADTGLQVAGITNVFHFERRIQEFAAGYLVDRATKIVEIGYGLGFSAKIFLTADLASYTLVEANAGIARRAFRRGIPPSSIQTISWQSWLQRSKSLKCDGIYYDCFPALTNFRYQATQLDRYLSHFFSALTQKNTFTGTVVFI